MGEKIRLKTLESAELNKQRAIRCTKEVVQREEAQKREEEIIRANERWKKEKQQLFRDAHQSQLRAIAKQTAILEKELEKKHKEELATYQHEATENLDNTVQRIRKEAEMMTLKAVLDARLDEQAIAQKETEKVAKKVIEEKKDAKERAEREREKALANHTIYMKALSKQALEEKEKELRETFSTQMERLNNDHKTEISALKQLLNEHTAEIEKLRADLHSVTESRNLWEVKYQNLKMEFSDFINQFPGFRSEFILK